MKRLFYLLISISLIFFLCSNKYSRQHVQAQAAPEKLLKKMGKELAKKHQLTLLNVGFGILVDDPSAPWAINFMSDQAMTIDQARPLINNISFCLLYNIYHNPAFDKFCKTSLRKLELKDELIGFKLAFWDENVDRPLYPYLAQVRLVKGKIHYFYADPKTQALQEPIVESLSALPSYR